MRGQRAASRISSLSVALAGLILAGVAHATLPGVDEGVVSAGPGDDDPSFNVQDRKAVKPRHGFAAIFSPQGVVICAGAEEWRLRYVGYGDGAGCAYSDEVGPTVCANRVEYRR